MAPITRPVNSPASEHAGRNHEGGAALAEFFLTLGSLIKWAGFIASPLLFVPLAVIALGRRLAPAAARLSRILDGISGTALSVAIAAALIMLWAQLGVVIARYVFGLSFSWLSELVTYGFAAMFLTAAAGALRDDAHVRVDILRGRFPPRMRATIELAGTYLFLIPICLLIFWSAVSPSFVRSWASFEASRESDGLPILFLFRTLIPLFATLLLVQGLSQALKAAMIIRELQAPETLHRPREGA